MIGHIYFIKLQIPCFLMIYNNSHEFQIENFGFRFTIFGSDPSHSTPKLYRILCSPLFQTCGLVFLCSEHQLDDYQVHD